MNFTKPENLDGAKLRLELRAAGVEISDDPKAISLVDNELTLDIAADDVSKAQEVVANHDGGVI
jgi:hypothetical protein